MIKSSKKAKMDSLLFSVGIEAAGYAQPTVKGNE